ncbi:putative periplasmic linker protein [Photobacterium gaetbulicola Gung47]|uniref:Putative periplasmic linker protein n=1 Tax=Photobacterium gaetbulicola Gung47 TaxID=658445 RepID=A0A0C5WUQ4_9GAMM|nr:efflux RND transporter periplasmic adaptor subunit [Photobacterium gaetbulicola]AJR06750.1 putative periplasmic linker protein [Photobacterium gaetbulicola Gung47]
MLKKMSFAVLSMMVLAGCQEPPQQQTTASLAVSSLTVDQPITSQFRSFKGQVEAAENTPLAFRVEGELQRVLVKSGQQVKKGELLAELDADKFEQQRNDAQVQFGLATKQLQRGRELFERKMISKAELDELSANHKLTKVNFKAAERRLGYTRLVAPFDGVVADVPKESFEAVSPGETVVNLYQDDLLYINIAVSDHVLAMLNPQQVNRSYQPMARFGSESQTYPVTYLEHTGELEPQSQTYRMWFEMPQREPAILPGTSVSLRVDMAEAGLSTLQGYQLPMTAIEAGREAGQFFVWKLDGNQVHKVEVSIGQLNNHGAIVSSGISEGERLVTSSLRKMREGMEVTQLPAVKAEAKAL